MAWEAWFTLGVIGGCFVLLASNRFAPDVVLMAGLTLLLVSGILTPQEALAGLSNEGMATVGVLYVVVAGLRETGGVDRLVQSLLARPDTLSAAQLRLMLPVSALSAFLNNTPVVAMFIPAVHDWAKRQRLSVSKLMLPLSYAAIAGGTCTLIGTSTNLVLNGLLLSKTSEPGLHLFELAWVGVPITVVLIGYVVLCSRWLLPDRRPPMTQFEDAREYTVEMLVEPGSPLVGKSVEEAGLRQLPGLYLIDIGREDNLLPAVSPKTRLHGNDRLLFAGIVESVVDLQRIRGLIPATNQVFKLNAPRRERSLIEAVVSNSCPLVGKSIREGRFRNSYNAAVIAVARNGERIPRKIGDIVLHPGDTLLLEAHPSFVEQQRNSRDFFLVGHIDDSQPRCHERGNTALAIMVAMVLAVAFGWLSMLESAMLAAGLMILTRCVTGRVARRAVEWQVLIVIAASFGLGTALQSTGAATTAAHWLIAGAGGTPIVALAIMFAVTALLTALVTNNATAVLMFPIAMATAQDLGVHLLPFAITIMMGASASFATPIGYQTNLMVYGPGGYHFADYLRFGAPLTVLVGMVTVAVVPWIWPL